MPLTPSYPKPKQPLLRCNFALTGTPRRSLLCIRLYQVKRSGRPSHVQYTSMMSGADQGQWVVPMHFMMGGEKVHLGAFSFKPAEYRTHLPMGISENSSFEPVPCAIHTSRALPGRASDRAISTTERQSNYRGRRNVGSGYDEPGSGQFRP